MKDDEETHPVTADRPGSGRLETWGEIASYLGREIRTVQRWEKTMGLPVRRLAGADTQSRVFAFKHELDAWWREHEVLKNSAEPFEVSSASVPVIVVEPSTEANHQHTQRAMTTRRIWLLSAAIIAAVLLVALFTAAILSGFFSSKVVLGVLPFRNLGDPKDDYIAPGLTEEMVTRFAQLHPDRMSVVPLNSAGTSKTTTKTTYILQGTVRRVNDQVAVTAELVQAGNQSVVWANRYERDVKDLLQLQTEVADAIASEVFKKIPNPGPKEREVNREAYLAYLEGRYFWNQRTVESLQKAIAKFEHSTSVDATYAPAYAGLADSYELLASAPYTFLPPREAFPKAEEAARKAIQLDESLAEAHVSLGYTYLVYEWNLAAAEREFRRALELRPGYATGHQYYAYLLTAKGKLVQALEERKKAVELDPLSPLMASALGEAFYQMRQFDQSIAQNERALDLDPRYPVALVNIGRAYQQKGMHAQAQATFQKLLSIAPEEPAVLALLGHEYAVAGRAGALQIVSQLKNLSSRRYVPALYVALIYTGLGDRDEAFRWMDQAVQERTEYLIYLNVEPLADPLRGDPRFPTLLKQITAK